MCRLCEANSTLSRRRLLGGGLALAGAVAGARLAVMPAPAEAAPNAISPDAAL